MSHAEAEKSLECIKRLQEGDRCAFDELVVMYKKRAFSLVFNILGNVEDAKDIVQEGFLRVYTGIKSFRGDAKFLTWFYRILINLARDYIRKRIRSRKLFCSFESTQEKEEDANPPEPGDETLNPGKLVLNKELGLLLDRAVSELPGNPRTAFCMKYYEGMKIEEISKILECRASTVKVHLFRAAQALQCKLEPYLKKS